MAMKDCTETLSYSSLFAVRCNDNERTHYEDTAFPKSNRHIFSFFFRLLFACRFLFFPLFCRIICSTLSVVSRVRLNLSEASRRQNNFVSCLHLIPYSRTIFHTPLRRMIAPNSRLFVRLQLRLQEPIRLFYFHS